MPGFDFFVGVSHEILLTIFNLSLSTGQKNMKMHVPVMPFLNIFPVLSINLLNSFLFSDFMLV